ncbi:YhgE/Pip family protein [uncultured Enterococcus sp.]|uniref:YhgE/Pip family protein n=1 Tax=uncultured Enterococcus sp. TaxID=167972 RepID=UPI0025F51317|nr:YhgE/Pip domain-containing protein [uncultured Enterococcus sp.]
MQKIKNVFYLYRLDWQRVFKIPIAAFLIVALMFLPSLYAWFNIEALWDPYGNTGELPIAIYSDDKGATIKDKKIDIGKDVLEELHKNDQLGWQFVDSKEEVTEGVKSGKYYAGIYLPKNFSEDLISFTKGEIKKPTINYYFNEKINAIAPKITDKGAQSLKEEISSNFINTASSTLFKALKEVGYDIETNLVSINKIKDLILTTNSNMSEIDGYLAEVVSLHQKLPELKTKLDKANELKGYLPQVDELGEKIIELNGKMPSIKEQASVILTLQQKIPELQAAGNQLAEINKDFDSVEQTMTQGVNEAKEGLQVIEKVQSLWPQIEQLGQQASGTATSVEDFAKQLQTALPSIQASVETTLSSVNQLASDTQKVTAKIQELLDKNELTAEERTALQALVNDLQKRFETQATLLGTIADFLESLQQTTNTTAFTQTIEQLRNAQTLANGMAQRLSQIDVTSDAGINQLKAILGTINTTAQSIQQTIAQVQQLNIGDKVGTILTELIATLDNAQSLMGEINYTQLKQLLDATQGTVTQAIGILEKYQAQLPAIRQELTDANEMLNGHMDQIISAINKGADLYQNELPIVADKLQLASEFMQNDWPGVKTDITNTLDTVNAKFPDVENALNLANTLIQDDWPSIKKGIAKAAEAINKGEETLDLGQLIKLMKQDVQKESEFFTNPVDLKTTTMYPIANNGSASTPFYTALCLWVGALLFSSIATTDFHLSKKEHQRFTRRETFLARMLTFLTMSIFQTLIVTLGNIFLLGVDVKAPVLSVFFALLIGLTFMMIIYVLVALLGNFGKGVGIIILVLSISGGGGNYPIQVSGKFFQMINPLLPFTYAVNLLRESAGGVYWPNARIDIIVLVLIALGFFAIGLYAAPKMVHIQKKTSAMIKKSHIFH